MGLFSQNTKMKKSSQNDITVVNFTLPAFQSKTGLKTCPNAGLCAAGCYARIGTYRFSNVAAKHEQNLEASQSETFVADVIAELNSWLKKRSVKNLKVRIHDSGDFYSKEYLQKWIDIMTHFATNSRISFYAYTKQVSMMRSTARPQNFRVIFSMGGKQDAMIDLENDFHSRVFESLQDLENAGYIDGTQDDMIAAQGTQNKIGLVYHGAKSFVNTAWDKVSQSETKKVA